MTPEYFDVLIIGAGLSGIGSAVHLKKKLPNTSFVILEGREAIGGTWDLFRYPGIRSDSDMFTLGYEFKPWVNDKGIGDGEDIRTYIEEAAEENAVKPHIRFGQKVKSANFDSDSALWHLSVELKDGSIKEYSCNFFISCTGYYDYDEDYTPDFAGRDDFKGDIIEPQFWPENYDYSNKEIVVIAEVGRAVTGDRALAVNASHVTMFQRSPYNVLSGPQEVLIVNRYGFLIPEKWPYNVIRGANLPVTLAFFLL